MKFCIENIIKKLLLFTNFSPQNHDFELKSLPSIAVLHLPSAIGIGLISIAVGNAIAVACIQTLHFFADFKALWCMVMDKRRQHNEQ